MKPVWISGEAWWDIRSRELKFLNISNFQFKTVTEYHYPRSNLSSRPVCEINAQRPKTKSKCDNSKEQTNVSAKTDENKKWQHHKTHKESLLKGRGVRLEINRTSEKRRHDKEDAANVNSSPSSHQNQYKSITKECDNGIVKGKNCLLFLAVLKNPGSGTVFGDLVSYEEISSLYKKFFLPGPKKIFFAKYSQI